jgi:hypothetical protein
MRIVLRVLAAVFAFAIGVGAVAGLESLISRLEPTEIPAVYDRFYSNDLERFAAEETLSIKLDFHVRGIRLGSTEKDVIKTFGKPMSIESWETDPLLTQRILHYKGLDIRVSYFDGKRTVDSIDILSPEYVFQGVTVGTSVDEALRQLGPTDSKGTLEYDLFVDDGYVRFDHDGSKITGIMTEFAGC